MFNRLAIVKDVTEKDLTVEMRDSSHLVFTWPKQFFKVVARGGESTSCLFRLFLMSR